MSPHIQLSRLGLKAQPHVGDNVIHGSASPLEADSKGRKMCRASGNSTERLPQALTEKMTWLGDEFANDAFGKLLEEQGPNQPKLLL